MPDLTLRRALERVLRDSPTWEVFLYEAQIAVSKMNNMRIGQGFRLLDIPWHSHKHKAEQFDEDLQCALWQYWKREA